MLSSSMPLRHGRLFIARQRLRQSTWLLAMTSSWRWCASRRSFSARWLRRYARHRVDTDTSGQQAVMCVCAMSQLYYDLRRVCLRCLGARYQQLDFCKLSHQQIETIFLRAFALQSSSSYAGPEPDCGLFCDGLACERTDGSAASSFVLLGRRTIR